MMVVDVRITNWPYSRTRNKTTSLLSFIRIKTGYFILCPFIDLKKTYRRVVGQVEI